MALLAVFVTCGIACGEEHDPLLERLAERQEKSDIDLDDSLVPKPVQPPLIGSKTRHGRYLGRLSANRYAPDSLSNPYGAGSRLGANSPTNPYSRYGSPYSNRSWANPYATNPPKLYDDDGQYRGKLSANPYDPDSVSNPYGRYGNPYAPDSPTNPYGDGPGVYGQDE